MKDSISLGCSYNEKRVKNLLCVGAVVLATFSGIALIASVVNKGK
ncbi:hypothetical protein [Clostridium sp. Ade.TY]|nr:hypothetical protein [Clostridium sp. Ade.TY]